jgi:DNA-binding CsgD family transcriptional regulator
MLYALFVTEPGIGFSLVDGSGVVVFTNQRAAELFLKATPAEAMGRPLGELFGESWTSERLAMFEQIARTGVPVISRHIRHGVRVQSTIRLISEPEDAERLFLVVTVEGTHDPVDPGGYEIVESKLVHLGPLDPLTRREIEVLALIGHGMTTPQIAKVLHRSPRTVERHCDSIRAKLDGASRVQLAEFARRAGLRLEDSTLRRI